ncbi:TPA: hypothetical protein U1Z40_001221 [Streptococcus suis]|nr:hypothetical protein [Streptococcus suis]HEP1823796.1 hypothetical protein [Streptococcus suis]HEP1828487.1 hypothetical protein [Streptococcus suis]
MIENFATLEDIFADEAFESLVAVIRVAKVERLHPEIEKFMEIIHWVKEHGREPQRSTQIKERQLFSRLRAIRADEGRRAQVSAYDELNLLGDRHDR